MQKIRGPHLIGISKMVASFNLGLQKLKLVSPQNRAPNAESGDVVQPDSSVKRVLLTAKRSFVAAAIFSGAINILMLSGSLFMLQVYDRVLPSHSSETLIALIVLVVALYAFVCALEAVRSRLFARIGRYFDLSLRDAVFALNIKSGMPGQKTAHSAPFRDLDQFRTFLAGGGPSALFDLPWMPLYVVLLFLLNPWIGCLGLLGIGCLSAITWLTDKGTTPHQRASTSLAFDAGLLAETSRQNAETIVPLGMSGPLRQAWGEKNQLAGEAIIRSSDVSGIYSTISRFLRMSLQSLVLGLGAYLVISGKATGGVMIAASILLGRALAPVELAISHWRGFVAARQAYKRLEQSLEPARPAPHVRLPLPSRQLKVENLQVSVPGSEKPLLQNIHFELEAGDALGIIGPSGAGKSTLVRALVGVWPIAKGTVRLDGSTLEQWSEEDACRFLGYLPQSVELFAGSIGQNIARFDASAADDDILRAAEITGVSNLIRGMEKGFDTEVGQRGSRLSNGQRQRIALSRALYKSPFLVILDEPNSSLDNEGEQALIRAIAAARRQGSIVIMVAHRPNILQTVNKILVLSDGTQKAFGPRDEVLKRVINPVALTAGGQA